MVFREFLGLLEDISDFLFTTMSGIFNLYTTSFILCMVLGLWVVRKVARLFDKIF